MEGKVKRSKIGKPLSSVAALKASEIRYRRLFEAARDGIVILDAEAGTAVEMNPSLVEVLGFSQKEFLAKKIWELGFLKDTLANKDKFAELQRKEKSNDILIKIGSKERMIL